MKKQIPSLLLFGFIAFILGSCSTSSNLADSSLIKKRRYTKGYQVSVKAFNKSPKQKDQSIYSAVDRVEYAEIESNHQPEMAVASANTEITAADLAAKSSFDKSAGKAQNFDSKKARSSKSSNNLEVHEKSTSPVRTRDFKRKYSSEASSNAKASAAPASGESLLLYVILAIILPPLAVGLLYGIGTEFLISLVLTLLFFIPGMIYSLIKVFQKG